MVQESEGNTQKLKQERSHYFSATTPESDHMCLNVLCAETWQWHLTSLSLGQLLNVSCGDITGPVKYDPEKELQIDTQPATQTAPDSGEVRTTSSTGAQKGVKPERHDLIPVPGLTLLARLCGKGAEKYAEHNWRAGYEWSKSYAAAQRHMQLFWSGEDMDEEMGLPHVTCATFHMMALATFMQEHPEFDDRYRVPETLNLTGVEDALQDFRRPAPDYTATQARIDHYAQRSGYQGN